MKKIFVLVFLFMVLINSNSAQSTWGWNVSSQSPNYFGGKGVMLTDVMIAAAFEKDIRHDEKTVVNVGFGFMHAMIPAKYDGTVYMTKVDWGSYNQSMPATIPVNYYYKQAGLGIQFSLDIRYYFNEITHAGPYAGIGLSFDNIGFESHLEKFDNYNYTPDFTNYPETPSTIPTDVDKNIRSFTGGALYWRGCIGFNFKVKENKLFFAECYAAYARKAMEDDPALFEIYARSFTLIPSIGVKFFFSKDN